MQNDITVYEKINSDIKNYSSRYTSGFSTMLDIIKQFNDVKDLYVVLNKSKREVSSYDENERKMYVDNSSVEFLIEDFDLSTRRNML